MGLDLDRELVDDLESEGVEAGQFLGVVREEAHLRDAEVGQDLGADAVLAHVGRKAERFVGLTVSSPWSWSLYAWSLCARPMPRPSWPRM